MNLKKVIEILENEKACVVRNVRNECDRNCAKCDLVLPDADIINAYNYVLAVLNDLKRGEENDIT